jgi:hypothetical protein
LGVGARRARTASTNGFGGGGVLKASSISSGFEFKAGEAAWAQARAAAWRVPDEMYCGGEASAFPTAAQSAPRILGKVDWITAAISGSERRVGTGEGREGDHKGPGDEIGRGRPTIGDGEQDGTLDEKLERFALAWLAVGDADAAGEAAEGVGELRGKAGDVIEGEDPVEAGEGEEFSGAGRKRGEGRSGGIDESAEDTGGHRLAAAGRAAEDEDGIGSVGA